MAFTSCTKSNIVDLPENLDTPIKFDVYNARTPLTKASEINSANVRVDGIHVTAFTHSERTETTEVDGQDVTTTTNTTVYATDHPYLDVDVLDANGNAANTNASWQSYKNGSLIKGYWPATGSLDFVAWGLNANKTVTEARENPEVAAQYNLVEFDGTYKFTKFTYKVPLLVENQQDLVVSDLVPDYSYTSTNQGKISFQLEHILTRIGFKLQTLFTLSEGSSTPDVDVTISKIILHGTFVNEGTVDLTGNAAIVPSEDEDNVTTQYSLFSANQSFVTQASSSIVQIYGNTSTTSPFEPDPEGCYMMIMPGTVKALEGVKDTFDVDKDGVTDEDTPPYIEIEYQLEGTTSPTIARMALESNGANYNFAAGNAYEFIFQVSVDAIVFEGVVENWNELKNYDLNNNIPLP